MMVTQTILTSEIRAKPKPVKEIKPKKGVNKVSSHGALIKKAHAIMRDIVMERDGRCVVDVPPLHGHTSTRQAGHLFASTKGSVRFDLWNVHEQCSGCNKRHSYAPGTHYYIDWFVGRFGKEEYHRIFMESNRVGSLKSYELEELIAQFKLIRERQLDDKDFKPYFSQAEILSGAWSMK